MNLIIVEITFLQRRHFFQKVSLNLEANHLATFEAGLQLGNYKVKKRIKFSANKRSVWAAKFKESRNQKMNQTVNSWPLLFDRHCSLVRSAAVYRWVSTEYHRGAPFRMDQQPLVAGLQLFDVVREPSLGFLSSDSYPSAQFSNALRYQL